MKELEPHIKDKTEINALVPAKKRKVLDRLFPMPGHRIFELNLATGIINEVVPKKQNVTIVPEVDIRTGMVTGTTTQKHGGIIQKEGCLYASALNAANADKIFHRLLNRPYKKNKK